jgi:DNA mismatch repair protein MutS
VLTSFAKLAADRNYTRPEFNDGGELLIIGGRHPVIEELLRQKGERFVPNDLFFEPGRQQLLLITGPNMGGKSTYLRQSALIAILAQDRLLRSRAAGETADHRSHLHAHRRQR